jgi:hypothetical protein
VSITDPTTSGAATTSTPACTQVAANTAYTDRISQAGEVDQFCLSNVAPGTGVIVTLSHLPADFDLTAFGNGPASLRGKPFAEAPYGDRSTLVTDSQLLPTSNGTITPPELVQDVPLIPGVPVMDASLQRGTTDEAVYVSASDSTGGTIRFQVSGYNGANSNMPFLLNVTTVGSPTKLPCKPPTYTGTTTATPAPLTSIPSDTNTLFLVNKSRLEQIYGTSASGSAAVNQAIADVTRLAGESFGGYAIKGQVVYVDADPGVQAAYQAWQSASDQCAPALRNAVVTAINQYVDKIRAGADNLRFITIVGGDEVIPYGLVPDRSALSNEALFASELALGGNNNSLSEALSLGYMPTDNPYCDVAPVSFGATPLYTPQLACGRLVETPADISAAISAYEQSGGVRTPNASLAAGYDWMLHTAQDVDNIVGPTVPAASRTLMTGLWTKADIVSAMASAAHGYLSVDAHSNPTGELSSADFNSQTSTPSLVGPGDLPADLSNSVMFSVGCHFGLSVADTYVADPSQTTDWAQSVASRNGLLVGQSGFGIGDSDAQAYSARLLAMFAQNLNGSVSIGQALQLAKQRYLALGVASVYDAKAIEEATYYGLPMYRLGSAGQWGASSLPVAGSTGTATASSSVTFNDPLSAVTTPDGTYYVDGAQSPQVTPNEPVEPRTEIPLTDPTGNGLRAHDAIVENVTSRDITSFSPVYASVVNSASPPTTSKPNVSVSMFPSRLQSVVNYGNSQSLVLVPGQYLSGGGSSGTQRLFSSIKSTVLWCNSSNDVRPQISSVDSWIDNGIAHFVVTTPSTNIRRGVILFLAQATSSDQSWTHVELLADGAGRWIGTANVGSVTQIGQYFVQLSDGCNVGVSSNKGQDYSTATATQSVSISLPAANPANGLFPDPTVVTISAASGTYTVQLDGTTVMTCSFPLAAGTSCTVTISGDGLHVLEVLSGSTIAAEAAVPIDQHGPTINVNTSSFANQTFGVNQSVSTGFNASTSCTPPPGMTVASCTGPAALNTSTPGTQTATFTATDNYGVVSTIKVTYYVDNTAPTLTVSSAPSGWTSATSATFAFSATDPATNPNITTGDPVTFNGDASYLPSTGSAGITG